MKKFNVHLYDNINREYDRKNLYLLEVSKLQEKLEDATGSEKDQLSKKLKELVSNKANHEYNKRLADYETKEKQFIVDMKKKSTQHKEKIDKTLPKNVQKLEVRLFEAKEKKKFYEKYVGLTYDAELIYEQSKIEIIQIPPVIEFAKDTIKTLNQAIDKKSKINAAKNEKFQQEFKQFKIDENKKLQERISEVKAKQKEGIISKQATVNTIKELKRKYGEIVLVKSFECEKTYNEEIIKNKKYELNKVVKQKINTVDINVADLRRVYPIETEKTQPIMSYCTFLIPGLGQALNKQYIKSIIMFFATIYIYIWQLYHMH